MRDVFYTDMVLSMIFISTPEMVKRRLSPGIQS